MTLSKKTMHLILKKRNLKQVSKDTGVAYCSVYRLANSKNIDNEVFKEKTVNAISEYLSEELNYINRNNIIKLKGE